MNTENITQVQIDSLSNNTNEVTLMQNAVKIFHTYNRNKSYIECTKRANIEVLSFKELKKAVSEMKRFIKEEKEYITPVNGCTDYVRMN